MELSYTCTVTMVAVVTFPWQCRAAGKTKTVHPLSARPPFSVFFYALTIFILFLLIVCCVGRVARLKNRQPSTTMPGRRLSDRHSSQRVPSDLRRTLVIATIENLIRIGRQSSASNQNMEEPNHPITDVPLSPPSYDDAIKTPPPELPPPYSEVVNENAIITPSISDQRYI
ncbi:hypothetical protein KP79_PYT11115 [Mizuhopecten yessoensis]|uniref:Transmembrane protein n=1 Tax=Mizuhopecten yessoensis TaxID=6573 RepID=A0A210PSQ3_MIZYE|nr:hypothetical protein KP79_PYT11115 [Mizuhopecten yessoensis]